jgi:cellobiose dehydrogenase (acceptor)
MYSNVNSTHWTLVYKCNNCFLYDDPAVVSTKTPTSKGTFQQGWAQALTGPTDPTNPNSDIIEHNNGMGLFNVIVASATQASYSKWATMTPTATATNTATATATASYSSIPVPTGTTYDYIVVGGGAGGIPIADKLSASGKSVLLIEKGVASSARWGGSKYHPPRVL